MNDYCAAKMGEVEIWISDAPVGHNYALEFRGKEFGSGHVLGNVAEAEAMARLMHARNGRIEQVPFSRIDWCEADECRGGQVPDKWRDVCCPLTGREDRVLVSTRDCLVCNGSGLNSRQHERCVDCGDYSGNAPLCEGCR